MAAKTVYEPYNAAPIQAGYDQMAALTKQSLDISNALTNASIYPTPTGKAPAAASNSYATKNSALGRYNTAVQALTAVSTGIEIGQILSSSRAQARALEARARSNMQQMDLNYAASRLQSKYWGEENLSKVSHILEEGKITIGEAMAGMGGSGFDVSAGDQRVLRYSGTETAKDIDAALRETGADIEDNVQFVLAKKQKCYIVVTNNYKDYRFLQGIEVLRPAKIRKIPQ